MIAEPKQLVAKKYRFISIQNYHIKCSTRLLMLGKLGILGTKLESSRCYSKRFCKNTFRKRVVFSHKYKKCKSKFDMRNFPEPVGVKNSTSRIETPNLKTASVLELIGVNLILSSINTLEKKWSANRSSITFSQSC